MPMYRFFRRPAESASKTSALIKNLKSAGAGISSIQTEYCFNIGSSEELSSEGLSILTWLLSETFEPDNFSDRSFLKGNIIEVGPRLNFQTAWSSNAVSICKSAGISKVYRIERSRRFALDARLSNEQEGVLLSLIHDRMTECRYREPLEGFHSGLMPEPVYIVPVLENGRQAISDINRTMGLGLDDWDIDYYHDLFVNRMRRNPTNVECFDLGQSNSEHSRHWFFKGRLIIDGTEMPDSLMDIISLPYKQRPGNSTIAFSDNSSAIEGFDVQTIMPQTPGSPSAFVNYRLRYNPIFTAETHNFPSGVAPFPGAETGTGGRIRDVQATGRGGLVIAGTAAYCVGNLHIPGYVLPWEDADFKYPSNLASPLEIEIEASNGASDYGNKFGEPVIQGFTRSFGMKLPGGERREWIKPIMFTGGIGQMDSSHTSKNKPERGMLVTKAGGPAYRIGMGGGAASSMVQGTNLEELDFNAVQRGDAEMEQKLNKAIRACIEMKDLNPIESIHDQGAGGNCNVLKEICDPEGAEIDIRKVPLGDDSMSVLEIWGAEYQEQNALLIKPESKSRFKQVCEREKVPCAFVGEITGEGRIKVTDGNDGSVPVDLDLKQVLGKMPRKTFDISRTAPVLNPLSLPSGITVMDALNRVLRLVSVGSKRFLANKVDRSVTGLIAQQQCCGPLGLTVSDVAVVAQSHFGLTGAAISIGEQPIKGLINSKAMARLSVGEALTNIVWANLTSMEDIRCSANWMWAGKQAGEGALIYDAALAMAVMMQDLGIAVDGGKDSLSMAAVVSQTGETVKAPGALVISAYCTVKDITKTITPDIKRPGESSIIWVALGGDKCRLGGSSLAHAYGQIGDESPDIEDSKAFKSALSAVQGLIEDRLILSGHDISDGGLVTSLLEMAFSGNCGLEINIESDADEINLLFSEEAGLLMEVLDENKDRVLGALSEVDARAIGKTAIKNNIKITVNGSISLDERMEHLRAIWEETSHMLDRLQAEPECVDQERENIYMRTAPSYRLSFKPEIMDAPAVRPRVAIIREEGSNGDREMASAFYAAGFEPWDIAMTDLLSGRARLSDFRGAAFVGGFSYADVMDSSKGWAGSIMFNGMLREQFNSFYARSDTFSLGVCNGCQLMALLGWVPWRGIEAVSQPRFIRNKSGRLESRFSTVRVLESPAMMLWGMEGSVLGAWVNHGEGMYFAKNKDIQNEIIKSGLAPIRFADDSGAITESYPFNPNGSPEGIAALCSPDGRHLAMMPHPERTFLKWQWQWMPNEWRETLDASPWLRMFQNARIWCEGAVL